MAILAGDIKKGVCLRLDDGKIYVVIDFLHVKPGKGNTVMRTKLRNVEDGRVLERTWIHTSSSSTSTRRVRKWCS